MEEILAIILQYVSIWAPSIVAIFGVIATILAAMAKTKDAFQKLNKDETLKDVNKKLTALCAENQELARCNKLLLDKITQIEGYADFKKKEE